MDAKDYVGSLVIRDTLVNIGLDDYGQCYYFEYYDPKYKQLQQIGCGTYNEHFIEEVCGCLDHKGFVLSCYGREYYDEMVEQWKEYYNERKLEYPVDKGLEEWWQDRLEYMNDENYGHYDFDAMYKEFFSEDKESSNQDEEES